MMSDLNMSPGKVSDFGSFPLSGFTLVIKLGKFHFEGHYFLIKKNVVKFDYVLSNVTDLV